MQGGQGTVGHSAACGDGANTGSHPAHGVCSGAGEQGRAWCPPHVAPEWLHCPGTGTRDTSAPPAWLGAGGLVLTVALGLMLAVGLARLLPSPSHAELRAGSGSPALIAAAQPADLALNPSTCHRLCSSQRGAGGGQGPRASCSVLYRARHLYLLCHSALCHALCCAMLCCATLRAVLCQTPASSERQEGPS